MLMRAPLLTLLVLGGLSPQNSVAATLLQLPGELARSEAAVARPYPEYALFYNPAAPRRHRLVDVFGGVHANHGGYAAYQATKNFESKETPEQIDEITKLLDRPLHLSVSLGTSYTHGLTSVGFLMAGSYRGSAHSEVNPRIDIDLTGRGSFYVSQRAMFLKKALALGVTLKPSYKIEHLARESALTLIDKKSAFSLKKHGREGLGLGVDAGVNYGTALASGEWTSALTLLDVGATSYKRYASVNPDAAGPPASDKTRVVFSTAWRSKRRVFDVATVDLFAAFWLQEEEAEAADESPLRVAASFGFGRSLSYAIGYRPNAFSQGLRIAGRYATFHIGTHTEAVGEYGLRYNNTRLIASVHALLGV